MSHRFSFTDEEQEAAAVDGRALIAVAYDGPQGRLECFGPCDVRIANLAMMIFLRLCEGMSLDDAIADARKTDAEFEAKQAGKVG